MALCLRTTVLIVVLVHAYQSIEWTSGPQSGTTLHVCVGDDVIIPWTYALGTGDVLHDIQWLYQGQSQEVIAIFSHGTFVPLPAFANRVQRLANGGLQISHVTQADRGNYSVEITGSDMSNNHIFLQKYLQMEIADGLMTSGRQLHVTMNPTPVLDNATNTYSIELQCGHFLVQYQPPFDVEWLTPSGSLHGSSYYKGGQFSLLLPLQAKGGDYTCMVSANTTGTCASRDTEASVVVDAMDIRLALMEARLTAVETERRQLQDHLNAQGTELVAGNIERKQLQGELNATTAKLTAADTERKQLQSQLNATTAKLTAADIERTQLMLDQKQLQGQLDATTSKLTAADIERKQLEARLPAADTQRKEMQGQLNATTIDLAAINQRNKLVVSFHAADLLTLRFRTGDHLILPTIYTNQGNGYNNNTGIFTAPVSGTYCFIASTGTMSSSSQAGFSIMHGGLNVGFAQAYGGDSWETATGHAVLHLVAGDIVWLKATNNGEYFWIGATWFSGVLTCPDP